MRIGTRQEHRHRIGRRDPELIVKSQDGRRGAAAKARRHLHRKNVEWPTRIPFPPSSQKPPAGVNTEFGSGGVLVDDTTSKVCEIPGPDIWGHRH